MLLKMFGSVLKVLFVASSVILVNADHIAEKSSNAIFAILPGLDIVESEIGKRESRFLENGIENDNVVYRVMQFLDGHEVRLKLQNMLNSSDVENVYNKVVESFEAENGATAGE